MIKFVNKTKVEKVYKPFAIYKGDKIMMVKQYDKLNKQFKEDILNFSKSIVSIFISIFASVINLFKIIGHLIPIIVIIKEDK